jgi:Tfp pilus assembly protein PilF
MWAFSAFLRLLQADYTTEGMKALDEGKYEAAAQAFHKAIEADSKDYFAHFNLAMAYTLLERDPEAVTEYRRTLELKPGLYEAELNGGIVLLRQKNPVEALPLFEAAAAQKPQEFRPRYYLAESQLQTGDYAKAEESYKLAIALDAKSAGAHLGMAQSLVQQGRVSDADPYFRQAAQLEPKYRDYLLELAGLYEKDSQNSQAIVCGDFRTTGCAGRGTAARVQAIRRCRTPPGTGLCQGPQHGQPQRARSCICLHRETR